MPSCCIRQCSARKNINRPELTFHRFPVNEISKKKWLEVIGIENINPRHKMWYVCSMHFDESCFNRTLDVTRLRVGATPSLSLQTTSACHLQPSTSSVMVCKLHFEEKFFNGEKRVPFSWPTLFTEEEILTRKPTVPVTVYNVDPCMEHNYSRKRHFDHTYCTEEPVTEYGVLIEHNYNQPQKFKNNIASEGTIVLAMSENVTLEHCYDQHCHHDDYKYLGNPESLERARYMSKDHIYSKKHHCDHSYAKDSVLPDDENIIDPKPNTNLPQLNALLSQNDEKDLDARKSSLDEKTDLKFGKHVVESKASRDSPDSNPYAEGIPELYNDLEEPSFQDLQESQEQPLFSWEKNMEVVSADDGDSVACLGQQEGLDRLPTEISLYCDDDSCSGKSDSGDKVRETEYDDYKCNLCQEIILGFRYTCVQCADYDLCAACEARGAHDAHYVLRVPGQRPYSEIQAVLHALRQQILSENLFLDPIDDRLKEEVKIEPDETLVGTDKDPVPGLGLQPDVDPLPVLDPLSEQRPESQNTCESSEESDAESPTRYGTPDEILTPSDHSPIYTVSSDDSDASRSPRRKRKRTASPETYQPHNHRLPVYYIPQKQPTPSTTSHNPIIHSPRMPTRFYQMVNRQEPQTETNAQEQSVIVIQENQEEVRRDSIVLKEPIVCLNRILDQENFMVIQENLEEVRPRESIVQKEPIVLVPRIDMLLQQGNLRETVLQPLPSSEDHASLVLDQSQLIVIEDDEPIEILPENLKNQNEQPEFILKLPPNTNEEALIQALQSLVTVRLKRDF